MNTPSHALIAAGVRRAFPRVRIPLAPVLWGSVAPDIPLAVLTLGGLVYFCGVLGWPFRPALDHMLGTLYLHDPVWLAARSALHAPLVIAALAVLSVGAGAWGRWLAWFAAACALHALLDILTHATDGPLLLFPFDWTTRFHSPVSYWDPRYHGRLFARVELLLDAALVCWLAPQAIAWTRRRGARTRAA